MSTRHFLTLLDFSPAELRAVIDRSIAMKAEHEAGNDPQIFRNKVLGMIFEKSSTRTRVSFEAGMAQLGGHAMFLSPRDTQLGRGEPVEDSARILSRMVDIIMIRTFAHDIVEKFSQYSRVPVINALTDDFHPCQVLADVQTWIEHRGEIAGKTVAWIGDGNNMCQTWIQAAAQFGFKLRIACPPGFEPNNILLQQHENCVSLGHDIEDAVRDADLVTTDVWASMGQEDEQRERVQRFRGYQVNPKLMDLAKPDALFMHCLPAHRGEEVSEDMLDDPRSVVWDEAENRLHVQKALMVFLMEQSKK
ncbi:MAG: ornithine carbamoyltransferase [Cellvibrionales bacterium]|jgi:ornithine carbamoyltransferase|nr:ornithine carbamoyltransferase [Cellvibrionales bacterium]TXH49358.1 MAG: ornithine carbamoyltransferase [Cellvibrionales bacterium]HRG49638.1 ornithine carbamoyltransferase [Pseudomonadales bacterium]